MKIREATVADAARLAGLWTVAGLHFDPECVEWDLMALRDQGLTLVAEDEAGVLAGSVMGSFDGRRGWINRLAVSPEHRGQGIATGLLAEVECRLAAKGCPKVNLLVEPHNAEVVSLYVKLGYRSDELIFMEKFLPN